MADKCEVCGSEFRDGSHHYWEMHDSECWKLCAHCSASLWAVLCTEADKMRPASPSTRQARCPHCKNVRPSNDSEGLPFFEPKPEREFDTYYCGCRGWD